MEKNLGAKIFGLFCLSGKLKRVGQVVLAVTFLLSLSLAADEQRTADRPFHHFQLPCGNCHNLRADVNEPGYRSNADVREIKGDINQMCTSSGCHNIDPVLSHPVGIKPGGPVPKDLPLDINSNITCLTCHQETGYSDGTDDSKKYFLRRSISEQLCASCHMNITDIQDRRSHWQFSQRAHLDSIKPKADAPEEEILSFRDIDSESLMCLSCHDEVTVTLPSQYETYGEKKARFNGMADHPIGMEYEDIALAKPGYYFYPQRDQEKIRLFDGRVGCGSCHSLYAKSKSYLVDTLENDVLCIKCHDLK